MAKVIDLAQYRRRRKPRYVPSLTLLIHAAEPARPSAVDQAQQDATDLILKDTEPREPTAP